MNQGKKAKVSTKTVNTNGVETWRLPNGRLHRENGPAVTYSDGTQYWYFEGKLHREDGPAITYPNGSQIWYLNDDCIKRLKKEKK